MQELLSTLAAMQNQSCIQKNFNAATTTKCETVSTGWRHRAQSCPLRACAALVALPALCSRRRVPLPLPSRPLPCPAAVPHPCCVQEIRTTDWADKDGVETLVTVAEQV